MSSAGKENVVLTITAIDYDKQLEKILNAIKKHSDPGHSFTIIVDAGDENEEKFGFDGDGSDRILSIEAKYKDVEKAERIAWLQKRIAKIKIDLEKVIAGSSTKDYIDDFVNSGSKRFKGKSKAKRIEMAVAASYGS